jgi:ferritin-like metal-binding protein YciE
MATKEEMGLQELFVMKLKALYDVENEIIKALPKMAEGATDDDLREAFNNHLIETERQKNRLEQVFDMVDEKPKKEEVEAIRGMIEDTEWCIDNIKSPDALDLSLMSSASHVEHYEMASYISAVSMANALGYDEAAELLNESLEEEENADEKVTELAEEKINELALEEK